MMDIPEDFLDCVRRLGDADDPEGVAAHLREAYQRAKAENRWELAARLITARGRVLEGKWAEALDGLIA